MFLPTNRGIQANNELHASEILNFLCEEYDTVITGCGGSLKECHYSIKNTSFNEEMSLKANDLSKLSQADFYEMQGPLETNYDFNEKTSPDELRKWVLEHYKKSGINNHECIGAVLNSVPTYKEINLTSIKPNASAMKCNFQDKINAYAELIRRGVKFPPFIVDRRNMLLEGYHRYAAMQKEGVTEHFAIKLN